MSSFMDKAREFFHLSIPVSVEEGKVVVPSFEIPLDPELPEPLAEPLRGTIAVETEDDKAVVKVALKKKALTPKLLAKKAAKKPVSKMRQSKSKRS